MPRLPENNCLFEGLRSTVTGLLITAALASCVVTAEVQESRQAATGIEAGEAIVILTKTDHTDKEVEDSFTDCVSNAFADRDTRIDLYPEQDFMDSLFPWFEPRLAPTSSSDLPELLGQPGVADKIAETHVRYLVWVDGSTETVNQGGSMTCALGPGGGGCLGLSYREKDSSYEAAIWDLKNLDTAGSISSDASGTSYMAGLIVPIPMIARTQKAACQGLAAQLKQFLLE